MRGAVWLGPGEVSVTEVPPPEPDSDHALVDVSFVGVCGTDLHIVAGEHPRAAAPLVLGHEVVGRLATDARGLPAGSPVMVNPLLSDGSCDACRRRMPWICEHLRLLGIDRPGGAADQVAVATDNLVPLPHSLPLRLAALTEPLAVAVHAIRRGGVRLGDTLAVIGAGPIGQLLARASLLAGAAEVFVAEPSDARRRLLPSTVTALDPVEPISDLLERTSGIGVDVVFDAAAHPSVAASVTRYARPAGTIVVVGTYAAPAALDLQAVNFRELSVVGTRVYAAEDVEAAIALLDRGGLAADELVTDVLPLEDVAAAIDLAGRGAALKVLLDIRHTTTDETTDS